MSELAIPPLRAILFDLDDTLWPLQPLIHDAEQAMLAWLTQHAPAVAALGLAQMRAQREQLIATEPRYRVDLWSLRLHMLRNAFAHAGVEDEGDHQAQAAMQAFADARNRVALYQDVLPALTHLQNNYSLGTISNGFADLHKIGLAQHFTVSLAAHQFGRAKPDASIFHAACEALHIAPQEALYIGDDLLLDVQGAQDAGLHAIWLNRGHAKMPGPEHAHIRYHACCENLIEVCSLLSSHNKVRT